MSRRTIISVVASVIIGIGCIATISTDAFAYRGGGRAGVGRAGAYHGGVRHAGVYRGGVYRGAAVRRGVAVGVGAAAVGCCLRRIRRIRRCPLRILSLSSLQLLELVQNSVPLGPERWLRAT